MTLEKITEYHSDEYRCKVSLVADAGWRDEDVYCLVTNETGNLNPNAARDIARGGESVKVAWYLIAWRARPSGRVKSHKRAIDTGGVG